ncbi:MAG: DNA-binding protein, partial [Vicinamibacteria bacterium]|nr:DNA-binding protein [Vicinamibacteria bacterium]
KLSVEIPDENAVQLRTVADRLGVGLEQLARAAIVDLAAQQAADFENATSRVLSKNKELYRRLA